MFLWPNWCQVLLLLFLKWSWYTYDPYLSSGGQKAVGSSLYGSVLYLCFLLFFFPILSYDVPVKRELGKDLNWKESDTMTEFLTPGPTISLCIPEACDRADDALLLLLYPPGKACYPWLCVFYMSESKWREWRARSPAQTIVSSSSSLKASMNTNKFLGIAGGVKESIARTQKSFQEKGECLK